MARRISLPTRTFRSRRPLSIEELELGLLEISADAASAFWDDNVEDFRDTVATAIRETSDILLTDEVPQHWRAQFVRQLRTLREYFDLADRYLAKGSSGTVRPPGRRAN